MKNLAIQFHTDLIYNPVSVSKETQLFYDNIWKQPYYMRPDAYWELPRWVAELDYLLMMNDTDLEFKVLRNTDFTVEYTKIFGSVLDSNFDLWIELINNNPYSIFILGGYVDYERFNNYSNVYFYQSMETFAIDYGFEYKYGTSYRLFYGNDCIPRITLSTGCKHHCSFCTIANEVIDIPIEDIEQQIMSLNKLNFELVYIDDKTFGQSLNHLMLTDLYEMIIQFNPKFKGFIIQTTTTQLLKMGSYLNKLKIHAVELGIETMNDSILKKLHKPSSITTVAKAVVLLQNLKIKLIPNIVIGFLEETRETYQNTIDFIIDNQFMHINLTDLAIYGDTELGRSVKINDGDSNETSRNRTYNSSVKNELNSETFDTIIDIINLNNENYDNIHK